MCLKLQQSGKINFSKDSKFITEGKFVEYFPKTQKTAKRNFYLFSDIVIIAKRKKKTLTLRHEIPLECCTVWNLKAENDCI